VKIAKLYKKHKRDYKVNAISLLITHKNYHRACPWDICFCPIPSHGSVWLSHPMLFPRN